MLDNQVLDDGMEILEKRFKVIKRLGNGSFGEIYKGKYPKGKEALKLLFNHSFFSSL
jgi:hypothetical protein